MTKIPVSVVPSEENVRIVLDELSRAFDLDFPVGDETIGSRLRQRLEALVRDDSPEWGVPGRMSQISLHDAGALRFYYRPHLFPDMSEPLRLGHALQFDLLPRTLPSESPLEVAALLESYCHLSGDLIGWHQDGGELVIWIADVSGHGIRAGLAAGVLYFLIGTLDPGLAPEELLHRLNRRMVEARQSDDSNALYLTAFVARVDHRGNGSYASAGHPSMLLRRRDGAIEHLSSTGLPIGLFESGDYESRGLRLGKSDNLVLFTDGVVEVRNDDGREYGREALERSLDGVGPEPDSLTRAIYKSVTRHCPSHELDDDMTLIAARLVGR